jgi:hypothetical protein
MTPKGEHLFPELNKARYGESRRFRPLFLPRFLREPQKFLEGPELDRAHEIVCKWAEIESSGKLAKMKETTIEGEFCKEVFGDALGYDFFADNKERWNFQPKFFVNGGQADAAIGNFDTKRKKPQVRAVLELKGPTTNVDKDRSQGRTAVQQCWDYLNALPDCPWGIVCNYVSFRLYHRTQTPRVYELFTLNDLRDKDTFIQFYYLFGKGGLLPMPLVRVPRADSLLQRCLTREREVGDELYDQYHDERLELISHLSGEPWKLPLDKAIRVTQKLLDRTIFVAFCEDRNLLPENSLKNAWEKVPPFHRVTNPRWQNFLNLFESIDKGGVNGRIPAYDGGLFRKDPEVDDLQLDDDWTDFFKTVGGYDFAHEINVDVLGHLFEKSINDIEKVRLTGLFESEEGEKPRPRMSKSAERKKGGVYYTPPEFTTFITYNTVGTVIDERIKTLERDFGIRLEEIDATAEKNRVTAFAERAIEELREIRVVDPACGSGAFLIRAYNILDDKYVEVLNVLEIHDPAKAGKLRNDISDYILHDNLFGVDLSPEAVEIAQLALWLRSAQRGKTLADLSRNIICGNSLVSDPEVDARAFDWTETFPDVFKRPNPGFDCVIGNPPWERIKLQEREFFDVSAPEIASATSAARRRELIAKLETEDPDLCEKYIEAKKMAESSLTYIRNCGRYPLTGKGDINCYQIFAELAHTIVSSTGRVGLLVPTGIATDITNKDFFVELVDTQVLFGLYDFENKAPFFPAVHRSYKFSVLLFGGSKNKSKSADFVFFSHSMEDLRDRKRHISLSARDFKLLNPNTRTCPVFRFKRDANLTKYIYKHVPVLIDKRRKKGGNPWGIRFVRMFDQTNDAELFHTAEQMEKSGFKRSGPNWKKRKTIFLPLYEAKMIQMYDHRAASVVVKDANWMRQGQTDTTSLVQHQNPEFSVEPRWWVEQAKVQESLGCSHPQGFIGFKDITSPTNQRTMIASAISWSAVTNHFPLIITEQTAPRASCLLANLNSFPLDFVARQKIGGVTLNFFIVEQLPIFPPDFYKQKCPWNKRQTLEKWISDRVLRLTCTSNDMIPLAEGAGFKPRVHNWDPAERLDLQAQLDAAFFLLYGIKLADVKYILSTFSGIRRESETLLDDSSIFERILSFYDTFSQKST